MTKLPKIIKGFAPPDCLMNRNEAGPTMAGADGALAHAGGGGPIATARRSGAAGGFRRAQSSYPSLLAQYGRDGQ